MIKGDFLHNSFFFSGIHSIWHFSTAQQHGSASRTTPFLCLEPGNGFGGGHTHTHMAEEENAEDIGFWMRQDTLPNKVLQIQYRAWVYSVSSHQC